MFSTPSLDGKTRMDNNSRRAGSWTFSGLALDFKTLEQLGWGRREGDPLVDNDITPL